MLVLEFQPFLQLLIDSIKAILGLQPYLLHGLKTSSFQKIFQDNSIKRQILTVSKTLNIPSLGKIYIC